MRECLVKTLMWIIVVLGKKELSSQYGKKKFANEENVKKTKTKILVFNRTIHMKIKKRTFSTEKESFRNQNKIRNEMK